MRLLAAQLWLLGFRGSGSNGTANVLKCVFIRVKTAQQPFRAE